MRPLTHPYSTNLLTTLSQRHTFTPSTRNLGRARVNTGEKYSKSVPTNVYMYICMYVTIHHSRVYGACMHNMPPRLQHHDLAQQRHVHDQIPRVRT